MITSIKVHKDGRPDNVCQGCGYHKSYCCCKMQSKFKKANPLPPQKTSTYQVTQDIIE